MKDYRFLQQKYLVNTYPDRGSTFVSGDGAYLIDIAGNRYLDLMTNYGVNIFGHTPFPIKERLIRQLNGLSVLHGSFNNNERAVAAMSLVKRCGSGLNQVYFSNSGSEAIEAALKFAVLATGKRKFITCRNGFHGKTLGALSATSGSAYKAPFEPLLWTFQAIDYGNLAQLETNIDEDTAAVLIEPIQGEGGVVLPEKGYLKNVKKACDSGNILMIIDEIQTGVGRTGYFLASEPERLSYDIICLGKGLAGGIPVGATLLSQKVSENISKGIHTSTFGGNPLAAAGISATLDMLDERRLIHIQNIGSYFMDRLRSIESGLIMEVRGRGLMIGIEVKDKRDKILQCLQRERILAVPGALKVIRFLPPYIIDEKHVDHATETLKGILKDLGD